MEITIKIQNNNELILLKNLLASFSGSLKIENFLNEPLPYKFAQVVTTNAKTLSENDINHNIAQMSHEPVWTIEDIEQNYVFDATSVIGKWPGNESIEQLIEMLDNKSTTL